MDDDYPPKSGILPQYAHLKGLAENMPVIRKLLGMSEYGQFHATNAIARAVQKCIANNSPDAMR